ATDAAVGADRVGLGLARLVPLAAFAQFVLRREHQRAGRADADAVAAVDAGRVGERHVELGGDVRVEATPGDGDGEGVLRVGPAGFDALVAENALGVVAHVERVVDLDGLRHGGAVVAVTLRIGSIAFAVSTCRRGRRQIYRRAEKLQHHLAAVPHALAVGVNHHTRFGAARARRNENARAFQLDDADAAGVNRSQRLEIAERRRIDPRAVAGVENGGTLRNLRY